MPSQVDGTSAPFASRLRALMLEQEIGAGGLGAATGIDPRLIARYRAGTTEPRNAFGKPTDNARKLARALGVAVDDLLPPVDAPNGNDQNGVAAIHEGAE